jgi:hypothetical protein
MRFRVERDTLPDVVGWLFFVLLPNLKLFYPHLILSSPLGSFSQPEVGGVPGFLAPLCFSPLCSTFGVVQVNVPV